MSSIVTKSPPVTNGIFNCESRKKTRRKRRRNKSKNINLRKKRLRKFQYQKKTDAIKSNISNFEFKPEGKKIMSNWYWSNYRKAVQWQERHQVAHWKACALALLEENRYLLQIINQLHPGMHPKVSYTQKHLNEIFCRNKKYQFQNSSKENGNIYNNLNDNNENQCDNNNDYEEELQAQQQEDKDDVDCDEENSDDDVEEDDVDDGNKNDEIEFEMSEEMVEFFRQSYKHKMELQELKKKELVHKPENEIQQLQIARNKRSTEMKFLYGDGASMITGMETAVQLSFEKYCDTKSPKYWPNIPFRL